MERLSSIPDYFKNKEILITGGSGFIGKVLIEKLLRNCSDFKMIYLLLREKKGKTMEERVSDILGNGLFDLVRKTKPEVLKKIVGISGDVSELKLGLSSSDRARVRGVHVVFHVAASVRFDDSLKKATLMNTRGTREVMELMLEMSRLEVGVHVSTTYCNTDKDVIEERVYRDHGDWREAIRLAEQYQDDYKLDCLTDKCKGDLKNTYLLTKHLAENVTEDYKDRLPVFIYRPGVVVSMWKDPIPGWADNTNGSIGVSVAVGKGFLRILHINPDAVVDNMPVDVVVKGMLIATWKKGIQRYSKSVDKHEFEVYNCSMQKYFDKTNADTAVGSYAMLSKSPYNGMMRYPKCRFTTSFTNFRIQYFFYNVIVAFIVDLILTLAGRKPMLSKLTRKVYFAIMSVSFFVQRNWDFKCDKFWNLQDLLEPSDRKNFDLDVKGLGTTDFESYMANARLGSSKFILKEKIDIPSALEWYKWFKILYYSLDFLIYATLLYFLLSSRYFQSSTSAIEL